MVHKTKLKRISLAVCFAMMSFGAEAAGLGKLTVLSGLGEPLNAEIELLAAGPDELSSLSAIIAPEEAYKVQGIERPALHSTIKIEIKKSPSGSSYLKLSSNLPVSDPYLDMLIQVDWSSGRLLREYTLLLDPPGYSQPPVSLPSGSTVINKRVVVSPATIADAPVASSTSKPAKGTKKNSATSASPVVTQSDASPTDESKVTTAKGDTLYGIARNANVQNVSLDQVLVGIYQANKDAFIGNNMNRLKVGQIIRVPSSTELAAIPKSEAAQEIKVQSSDFQSYRNKLAGTVEAAPAMSDDEGKKSSGGKITKAAEDKATPAATAPKDVVKLSKGVSPDTKVLQDKVTGLQEEATAKEKTIKESSDRVAALEKQVADMQKLLVMKNQAMAEAQKNAAANLPAPAPVAPSKPEVTSALAPVAPVVADQPSIPTPVESAKPAEASAQAEKPADTAPAVAPVPAPEKKPVPVKKFTPPPPPVEEPGLFDDVNLPLVGGAGGFLALLVGGWLFLRNKRRRSLDGFEKDILTSGGLKANTVFGNTLGGTVDSGDTSFLTDFSPGTGMIDTHDVDPIAEAEVYMAYGRDSQAEEILKDAIVKEPKRYELHLKLLEMYAARKDSSAFETVAGELYSTLGTSDPTWAKVATLGRSFEPDNPLYEATEASETQDSTPPSTVVAGLVAGEVAMAAELAQDATLDFSLDSPETNSPEDSAGAAEDNVLDFDIGTTRAEAEAIAESHASTMEMQATKADEDFSTDAFDLDIGEEAEKPADNHDDLDFQLGLPEEAATDTVQLDMASFAPDSLLDAASEAVEEPSLDFDKTMVLNVPDLVETESSPEIDFSANEISFDLPEIKETEAEPEVQSIDVSTETLTLNVPETLDLPEIAEVPEPVKLSVPDFEKTAITSPDANEIDFSAPEQDQTFDLDLDVDFANLETEEITVSEITESEPVTAEEIAAPEIDLSGISLDLDATHEVSDATASSESSEVDTKLDLVTAYMDMGDNEGARELLDEVLKEGGVQQRIKAQEILKSLS